MIYDATIPISVTLYFDAIRWGDITFLLRTLLEFLFLQNTGFPLGGGNNAIALTNITL